MSNIRYLQRKDIDEEAWNQCVDKAENGLIYAYTFYLDAMCTAWDALVLNNYEAVMPLPWRKKWGIRYLYAPAFIQQLGLIGNHSFSSWKEVFAILNKRFKLGDLFFNFQNQVQEFASVQSRTNLVLDLNRSYKSLQNEFSNLLKKNLKVAKKNTLLLENATQIEKIIRLFQMHYHTRMPHVTNTDYSNFLQFCLNMETRGMAFTRTLVNLNSEVMAAALFLKDHKRIYNIINVLTAPGRKACANYLLYTEVIKEFSESMILFDFEGSDLKGVKDFYMNFNPVYQPYSYYHFNNLPFPLRLFKH